MGPGWDGEQPQSIFHGPTPIRHSGHHHLLHPAHARLHDFWDGESGKPLSFYIHSALVFDFLTIFLLPPQVIIGIRNPIRQCAQLFYQLEATKIMRAYIAHDRGGNEELRARLEVVEGETVVAHKLADEGVGLLRNVEKGNEVAELESRRLDEERGVMEAIKKKVDEKAEQLRQEL